MKIFCIALGLLLLSSCAPEPIAFLSDKARFQDYESFKLLSPKLNRTNLGQNSATLIDDMEYWLRYGMRERDFEENNLSPDLILRYDLVTNRGTSTSVSPGFGYAIANTRTFLESTIILELISTETNKMIWQSSYDLSQKSGKRSREATESAITDMFYTFPYRAGSKKLDEDLADFRAGRKKVKARQKAERKAEKARQL